MTKQNRALLQQNNALLRTFNNGLQQGGLISTDHIKDIKLPISPMQAFKELHDMLKHECKYKAMVSAN